MKMGITAALVTTLALFAGPSLAQSQAPTPELRQKVLFLIAGAHGAPPREVLLEATPQAKEVLVAIARDRRTAASFRGRAVSALSGWPEADVRALYRELWEDASVVGLMRHRVLLAHARAFRGEALPEISAALESPDLQLRLTALTALDALPEAQARPELTRAARRTQPALIRAEAERRLLRAPRP